MLAFGNHDSVAGHLRRAARHEPEPHAAAADLGGGGERRRRRALLALPLGGQGAVRAPLPLAPSAQHRDGDGRGAGHRPGRGAHPRAGREGNRRLPLLVHRPREVEVEARALGPHRLSALPAAAAVRPDGARAAARLHRALLHRGRRRAPAAGPLRKLLQTLLSAAQQLAIIGYYADPRSAPSTGYVPFSKRKRYPKAMKKVGELATLDVNSPNEVDADRITADVAIVGSGAAGSVLAYRLAERGREVVLLEGGKHVDPRDFTEDERVQFSNLFADGGLQMSTDTRFQVLQGKCVGGSTVINNAVCYDIPPHTLRRWNDPDGLDAGHRRRALRRVVRPAPRMAAGLQPGGQQAPPGGRRQDGRGDQGARARRRRRRGRREHQGLPRLRLLQHRLCLRQEALGARQHPAAGPARVPGRRPDLQRVPRRVDPDARASGRPRCAARSRTAGRSGSPRRRSSSPAGRSPRACCSSAATSAGERVGTGHLLQRRRPADRGLRGAAQLLRRAPDHPRLPADRRGPAHPRVLVQPGRDPGAAHAGLVLRPLPQHAPLRAPELHRRRGRLAVQRHRSSPASAARA